jgi:hypothetical protein
MLVFKFQNVCIPKIVLIPKLPQSPKKRKEKDLNASFLSKLPKRKEEKERVI